MLGVICAVKRHEHLGVGQEGTRAVSLAILCCIHTCTCPDVDRDSDTLTWWYPCLPLLTPPCLQAA